MSVKERYANYCKHVILWIVKLIQISFLSSQVMDDSEASVFMCLIICLVIVYAMVRGYGFLFSRVDNDIHVGFVPMERISRAFQAPSIAGNNVKSE